MATTIEGFQIARRGRVRAALATAAIGSFVAGTIGVVLLTLVAQPVADLAVTFRAEDYFALAILAFASVTALVGRSIIRGWASLALGLLIGCVGIDAHRPVAPDLRRRPVGQRHQHRHRRRRPVRGRRGAAHGGQAAPRGARRS